MTLLQNTEIGLYVPDGNFYIDPSRPVGEAVVTHAHADHARNGMERYYCTEACAPLLRSRLGDVTVETHGFGEEFSIGGITVSLHPAGHIRGSAQVRVDDGDSVAVVTGDCKRAGDPTCRPFEPLDCDLLVLDSTFGLPVYHWRDPSHVVEEVMEWWEENAERGLASVLFCYSLGKAQRLLAMLAGHTERTVYLHGAVVELTQLYREAGVEMVSTVYATDADIDFSGELVLAPTSARRSKWLQRFPDVTTGFASGWMQVRAMKRQRGYERGFVLSDHCDWRGLLDTVEDCDPDKVVAAHGYTDVFARYLRGEGWDAVSLSEFEGY